MESRSELAVSRQGKPFRPGVPLSSGFPLTIAIYLPERGSERTASLRPICSASELLHLFLMSFRPAGLTRVAMPERGGGAAIFGVFALLPFSPSILFCHRRRVFSTGCRLIFGRVSVNTVKDKLYSSLVEQSNSGFDSSQSSPGDNKKHQFKLVLKTRG